MLSVRIVSVDSYVGPPIQELDPTYSCFRGSSTNYVPVIRIFGSTPTGEKACIHVHGVFPYIYIPYDGVDPPNNLIYQIATNLDKSINVSLGQTNSNVQHVYNIQLVSATPMYGYHIKQHQFFKIYFYNPMIIKKASALLHNGSVLGKIFQPHVCHIPYVLQFMIDYNLHGMSYATFSEVHYRTDSAISSNGIPKASVCKLEGDVLAEHITNILKYSSQNLSANPGITSIWEDEKERRKNLNKSIDGLLPSSQPRTKILPTTSHITFKQALKQRLTILSQKKEKSKSDPNVSIYPAETPSDCDIMNASCLENTIVDFSESSIINNTIQSQSINQTSFDSEVENVLKILKDLGENADVEEDSVLTQVIKEDSDNEEVDFSISLDPVSTPKKRNLLEEQNNEEVDLLNVNNSYFSNLQISQLDGNWDDSDDYLIATNNKKRINNRNHQKYKKLQDNKSTNENGSECNIAAQSKLTNYNLDGTNDSSSSDEDSAFKKHLNVESNLSIMFESRQNNLDSSMISTKKENCFESNNRIFLNTTFIEEDKTVDIEINCNQENLTRTLAQNEVENDLKTNKTVISELKDDAIVAEGNIKYNPNTQKSNTSYHSEDLFSSENSFETNQEKDMCDLDIIPNTPSSNLEEINCVVCKYDKEANFIPVAGTSKLNNLSHETSSGSTIAPYQNIQHISDSKDSSLKSSLTDHAHLEQSNVYVDENVNLDEIKVWIPKFKPPTKYELQSSLQKYEIPLVRHQEPFYSDFQDVTGKIEIGNRALKINSKTTADLEEFSSFFNAVNTLRKEKYVNREFSCKKFASEKLSFCRQTCCIITPAKCPPTKEKVLLWLKEKCEKTKIIEVQKVKKIELHIPCSFEDGNSNESFNNTLTLSLCSPSDTSLETVEDGRSSPVLRKKRKCVSQSKSAKPDKNFRKSLLQSHFLSQLLSPTNNSCEISGPTLNNTHGFRMSLENRQNVKACARHQYLTTFVMELHTKTRLNFKPNPEFDPVRAIFYSITNDVPDDCKIVKKKCGIFAVKTIHADLIKSYTGLGNECNITYVESEMELFNEFINFFHIWNPDILAGYEIELLSWGYLIERGYILGLNLPILLSRITLNPGNKFNDENMQAELKLTGRIILNIWRLMKHEIALQSYTFENVYYHILHRRVPLYSFNDLSFWWEHPSSIHVHKTIKFYLTRVKGIIELIDNLDLIGQTSELARLFGIQFYEVLSRGSQFRVESMMLRLAKPLNYIPVSPSVQQRAKMRAPEYLPLILEPESKFYVDPVIVLDFQSLYPSIIIAYNYCFSTCLGRVELLGQNLPFEFGATHFKISKSTVKQLLYKSKLNFTPCGVAFVKRDVRKGILPRMLEEILETRLMVKKSMKDYSDDKTLLRVLHSRQLGLKLIANVTYGYTSANFSGRMPCVEVGDSVVSKARETLQRAINMVEKTAEWGAKVVYGDTDSLFVMVPGRSLEDAFKIGAKIAESVTNDNPSPVKLKLEKVYFPCILQTKKRYVGYMYESAQQKEPIYLAKGIETVRRDGCPAVSKMLEKCLRLLFETRDVSLIRKFVLKQFEKILSGRVSIQDLTFAKEFRGFSGYRPGACVPALELARKWTATDKRNQPRSGERVPYIIVNGPPGLPLIRLVHSPSELLEDPTLLPNEIYYITRVIIPPINRCLSLLGADLSKWFNEMPRKNIQQLPNISISPNKKSTITQYFATTGCAVCGQLTRSGLCEMCLVQPQSTIVILQEKLKVWYRSHEEVSLICQTCNGSPRVEKCTSLDCPVVYRFSQIYHDLQQAPFIHQMISSLTNVDI